MSFNPMGSSAVGKPRNAPLLSGFQPREADPRSVNVVRRAERYMTEIAYQEPVNPAAIRYINRLSDLMFDPSLIEPIAAA
jgi:hypothetical protein